MRLSDCRNSEDFRVLAKRVLPAPLFHYIDGGADDETTLHRNTESFEQIDLVPSVLRGVDKIDMSVSVLGATLDVPLLFSPTAMQCLFHPDGEWAVADAAKRYNTMYGISTIGTRGIEEMGRYNDAARLFQIYVHNDTGMTSDMIERCRQADFTALALTVDTIVAGNRERDFRTGMTTPPKFTLQSLASFAAHPGWVWRYLRGRNFDLPNVRPYMDLDKQAAQSVSNYIDSHLKTSITWDDAAKMIDQWQGPFAIKGVMSVADAREAVRIGASAIMVSNHGGRQLDGSRSPFDQISAIADAVGGEIEIILDGGIRRGSHVIKALAAGATACSGGRFYLYALAAAGRPGVEQAMQLMHAEIERDMQLMGVSGLDQLGPSSLAARA